MLIIKKTNTIYMQESLKPYLLYAFYVWSLDSEYTPLLSVNKRSTNQIPSYLQKENKFVLKIHPNTIKNLSFNEDSLEFHAIFNGNLFKTNIDYCAIERIFNYENNFGLDFEVNPEIKAKPKLTLIKNAQKTDGVKQGE